MSLAYASTYSRRQHTGESRCPFVPRSRNRRKDSPRPLVLMTPQVHSLHHSIDRVLSDSNYANIFPIWDIVFGTFSDPDRHAAGEIGVRDDPIPQDFLAQLLSPFTWWQLVKESASRRA